MNIKLDKLIDNSFVLSIHPKRLEFFYSQWKAAGLPGLPKHIQGVQLAKCMHFNNIFKHNDNVKQHVSAMLGHFMAVTMARVLKLPFVCIFEDDAIGCIGVKSKLEDILHCIPDDADIFILGNLKTFGIKSDLEKIIVPTKSFGMQSYIVFQNDYDYFLSHIMTDINCGLCGYGKNVYMAKDILFCQYSAFKDLNKQWCKTTLGFLHSSLSKDYIDKHFKMHCHSMTFNGGRLGNQLYYALQAYIQSKTYAVTGIDSQTQYESLLALGCKDLISDNSNEFTSKIDNYCQHVNKDFTIEQLNGFIDNVLLKSDFFKDTPLDSTSLFVNIRNGDYASNSSIKKVLAPFDRHKYIDDALKAASSTGTQKIVVVSDDIQMCKQYESIFKKYAMDIQYVCRNVLDSFKLLCGAKNKIIMNSTFSIWSSFISNRLFKDSEKCIYVPSVWSVNSSIDKCFQHITTRANKEWNIVDVEYTNAAVVKRTDYNAGFCSYAYTMFAGIYWCIEHGYKPIIDMQTSDNAQFHDSQSLNNVNVWENIFEQPSHLSLNDADGCKSIYPKDYLPFAIDKMSLDVLHDYARKYLRFKKEILDKVEKFYADNMSDNTVGIMIRGTDRTFIAYPGHKVQQSYDTYIEQLNSILKDNKPDKIYLMTESEEYFNRFKKDFPDSVSYQSIHLPENGQTIAQILKDKPYECKAALLEQYMVSLLLLSKCKYVILGKCSAYRTYNLIRQQPADKTIVMNELDNNFTPKIFKQDTIKNMKRYNIINIFIEKYNFQSYLEIGTYHNACFNKVFVDIKMSVDPDKNANPTFTMTSDEFFKQHADMKFDIVFIDGLHHSDQLLRDIENSLKCLNEGGVIVCHDCLPDNEHMQTYEKHSGAWTGDCWKAFAKYRKESPYECYVLDCDYGCGIIDTNIAKTSDTSMIKDSIADMTWQDFADNKKTWMNVKTQIV